MKHPERLVAIAVGVVALATYALTAARTITFWEGSAYPLLARTGSIMNPPGSLLLTILGRVLSEVPFAAPMAFRMSLIAAAIGAATAATLAWLAVRVAATVSDRRPLAVVAGGVAALIWTFALTPWTYATQFTPYGLTALFTALIVAASLRWWERAAESDAIAAAALVALLFGLDLSVHRTNLLLAPAALGIVLLRRPRALAKPRFLLAIIGGFALGASLQLLYIPMGRREPFLDLYGVDSLPALWRFIRLDNLGGGFLVDVWPRRANIVSVQLGDLVRFTVANLGGPFGTSFGGTLVALGVVAIARRSPRLALALLGLALVAGLGAVAYFNRPLQYFRSLDRHYLPFLAAIVPLLAAGLALALEGVRARAGRVVAAAVAVLALGLPVSLVVRNQARCDLSRTRFAETMGRDLLEPLAPDAVLITNGDNDTFPPWYLQQIENVRRDVLVVNASVAMSPGGAQRLRRADAVFEGYVPSDTVVVDLARRTLGRRPLYFAVTLVLPEALPGIRERMRLEGLVYRVVPDGEGGPDTRMLADFVRGRFARAGFDDPRQRLDDDVKPLGANYAAAALQLVSAQLAAGENQAALDTLDRFERCYPEERWPPGSAYVRDMVTQLRARAAPDQ